MAEFAAKRLSSLIRDLDHGILHGQGDPEISAVDFDSRRVGSGSLFVALRGLKADGTEYIHDAVARGATAIVSSTPPPAPLPVPLVQVPDARKALAELAWSFYGHPERSLTFAAVTGTNGKTTVATQIRNVLEFAGLRTGLVGTLGVYYKGVAADSPRTTPESVDMAVHFAAMRERGYSHVVMEATSIGIDLERTWKLPFRVAIFTNLTRDHLDYHGTVEAYRECKLRLFREQARDATAVINRDDPDAEHFIKAARGNVVTYGITTPADYRAKDLGLTRQATRFELTSPDGTHGIESPLVGEFNVSNLLAVIAAARALGVDMATIRAALRQTAPVRGRAEIVASSAPFTIVVDYAHTPDALEKILSTLASLEHNRIFTIVGAGGDRDRGKRPLMAHTAFRLSDKLFLTSDNPRSEDPARILDDMAAGLPANAGYVRNADRRATIETALAEAQAGDIILIAGKGHETYQEISGVKHPFDDRDIALQWLKRAGYQA